MPSEMNQTGESAVHTVEEFERRSKRMKDKLTVKVINQTLLLVYLHHLFKVDDTQSSQKNLLLSHSLSFVLFPTSHISF